MDRRQFLRIGLVGGGLALGSGWAVLGSRSGAATAVGPYGPLQPPDVNGLQLPAGFSSRVIATTGETVAGTGHRWHPNPDGGATFASASGGWIYVSNDESGGGAGGAGAVEFDAAGEIVEARTILSGTSRNCAGGATPWGTWLSCEEHPEGIVWECDPRGRRPAVPRPAMGVFEHEAAAVDAERGVVYLTEDDAEGGLYRFVPDAYPSLGAGRLEILVDRGGRLRWCDVPEAESTDPPTRYQVAGSRQFDGGEGAWFHDGTLWFTTKGDGRVWRLNTETVDLTVAYDPDRATDRPLGGVDNVTVAEASGEVYVAEDGGNMEICTLTATGAAPFVRVVGVTGSEVTGPAFSPDGGRLYFSSQRNPGRTYEVRGPFMKSQYSELTSR